MAHPRPPRPLRDGKVTIWWNESFDPGEIPPIAFGWSITFDPGMAEDEFVKLLRAMLAVSEGSEG